MPRTTLAQFRLAAQHVLGGAPSAEFDTDRLVSYALDMLVDAHPWECLSNTGPVSLSLTAGQNFVPLPLDFESLEAIEVGVTPLFGMRPVTMAEIIRLRSSSIVTSSVRDFYCCVNPGHKITALTPGVQTPRLELFPTPAADAQDALMLLYRRRPQPPANAQDPLDMPPRFDRLLILAIRAVAEQIENDTGASGQAMEAFRVAAEELKRMDSPQTLIGTLPRCVPVASAPESPWPNVRVIVPSAP